MILQVLILNTILSCGKEAVPQNYLPGKWNLVQTSLYASDTLQATNIMEEMNTVYYFSSCETSQSASCDMYIEEDGEKLVYNYIYDSGGNLIIIDENSVFEICTMNESELCLVRNYENYRSEYKFVREE